jgi:hypothetical protein
MKCLTRAARRVLALSLIIFSGRGAMAQTCLPAWGAFDPSLATFAGVDGSINTMIVWDPDGPGPLAPRLVIAGDFKIAGSALATSIATYDPSSGQWAALGTGVATNQNPGEVMALLAMPNGDLVAGGFFLSAGGTSANYIARWSPGTSSWSTLGSGMDSTVSALALLPNGDLIAAGGFTGAGGVLANYVARWNGTTWSPLGSGMDAYVTSLAVLSNGDLIAGGGFSTSGGVTTNHVARWNGTTWSSLGTGVAGGFSTYINSLTVLTSGDLVAGGAFNTIGGASAANIARWNGSAWSALGAGTDGEVRTLCALSAGNVAVGGGFSNAGGAAANGIAQWNASAWSTLGVGVSDPNDSAIVSAMVVMPSGDLAVGGTFSFAGAAPVANLARWTGVAWQAIGTAVDSSINAVLPLPGGKIVVGGDFDAIGGVAASRIAMWNGSSWQAMGAGMSGGNSGSGVNALALMPNGDVIAGGWFGVSGGVTTNYIARWNGTAWSALGTGVGSGVYALLAMPNGDVIAGGGFSTAGGVSASRIARWNGTTWSALGAGVSGTGTFNVFALALLQNGQIVAGGAFTKAGSVSTNAIARWNGSAWSAMGAGLGTINSEQVYALTVLPTGDLIAGGNFDFGNAGVGTGRIARWDGASWSALASGMNGSVYALTTLPSGDLAAAGGFTIASGTPVKRIARWNGAAWSDVGFDQNQGINAIGVMSNGDLVAGGTFTIVNAQVATSLARDACPAQACYANCDGSAGSPVLTAADFVCFLGKFRADDAYANCDGSTGNPSLTAADFVCFLNSFRSGCQ